MIPRYLTSSTSSIALLLIRIVTGLFVLFLAWKITKFVLVIFKESLFMQSYSYSFNNSLFMVFSKHFKSLDSRNILVLSANR